jgi:hypothetical protein
VRTPAVHREGRGEGEVICGGGTLGVS